MLLKNIASFIAKTLFSRQRAGRMSHHFVYVHIVLKRNSWWRSNQVTLYGLIPGSLQYYDEPACLCRNTACEHNIHSRIIICYSRRQRGPYCRYFIRRYLYTFSAGDLYTRMYMIIETRFPIRVIVFVEWSSWQKLDFSHLFLWKSSTFVHL